MTTRQEQLVEAWCDRNGIEPVSTERLLEQVSQKTGADPADIAEALYRSAQEENS